MFSNETINPSKYRRVRTVQIETIASVVTNRVIITSFTLCNHRSPTKTIVRAEFDISRKPSNAGGFPFSGGDAEHIKWEVKMNNSDATPLLALVTAALTTILRTEVKKE